MDSILIYTNIRTMKSKYLNLSFSKNKDELLKNSKEKKKFLKSIKAYKNAKFLQEAIDWCDKIDKDIIDKVKLNENQYLRLGVYEINSEKIFNIHIFEKLENTNICVVRKIIISSSENDSDIDYDTQIIPKNN